MEPTARPQITPESPSTLSIPPTATSPEPTSAPEDVDISTGRDHQVTLHPSNYNDPISNEPLPHTKKIPAALKRILPHNSEGLSEGIVAPEDGGRRKRRH